MISVFRRKKEFSYEDNSRIKGKTVQKLGKDKESLFPIKVNKKINPYEEKLSIDFLVPEILDTFNQMLRNNIYENAFSQEEIEYRLQLKKELRWALRNCAYGDYQSKTYVKDYIKEILIKKYGVDEQNIYRVIPFHREYDLKPEDQFDILLYSYEKEYERYGLEKLMDENHLDQPKRNQQGNIYYEITKEDIERAYYKKRITLAFYDQLEIITQRIFQRYKGNGVIDQIRDMKIDGLSAGVSGIPEEFQLDSFELSKDLPASYESIWIFYKGKSIHLSFLSFYSYKELIRVCKNIYRYNNPGQLSEVTGYIVNEMKDGSRVSVARPPFCESWVLFIRKFDTVLQDDIHHIITDSNGELPIKIMQWLIKGYQIIGITGEQGAGKTTLLMSLIAFIDPTLNLRIQELSFELHLRKIYPKRNIVTFREVNDISGQEGLDFQKKTDGAVNILGEVATAPVANWLVQMSMVASLFTLFTHHAKTTKDLVISLRNALLLEGGFSNEYVATEQVVGTIHFDIHMRKSIDGHRYIERITEIVPKAKGKKRIEHRLDHHTGVESISDMFETRDIVVWEEGRYQFKNYFSSRTMEELKGNLTEGEMNEMYRYFSEWGLNKTE